MLGKKGVVDEKPILLVFEVLLLVVVLGSLVYYVQANADDTNFKQQYYKRDIALTVNSMLSSHADISVSYTLEEDFTAEVYGGYVTVTYKNRNPQYYPYLLLQGKSVVTSYDPETNVLLLETKQQGVVS